MSNLFAAPQQQQPSVRSRSVVKFKCGRMKHERLLDGSYHVTALPERGYLELRSDEDQANMFRLVWSTRAGEVPNDPDNNVILVKSEQTFDKVSTGNDGDRVFLLSMTNSDRRFFFWVQDPTVEGDEELLATIRQALGCNETDALNAALIAMGILPDPAAAAGGEGGNNSNSDGGAGSSDQTADRDGTGRGDEDTKDNQ
jgi:hypothetical protein